VLSWIANKDPRFITFTLKHTEQPLSQQLTHLWASFRRLRNSPVWKQHVMGGIAFFEVKLDRDNTYWHPHLHCLVEGHYFHHQLLKDAWFRASRGSFIVDIQICKNKANTARYVSAYATKGWGVGCLRAGDRLVELIAALHHRRLCTTFGKWRGLSLRDPEGEETWAPLMSLDCLRALADAGSEWHVDLLRHLHHPDNCPPPHYRSNPEPRAPPSTARQPAAALAADWLAGLPRF